MSCKQTCNVWGYFLLWGFQFHRHIDLRIYFIKQSHNFSEQLLLNYFPPQKKLFSNPCTWWTIFKRKWNILTEKVPGQSPRVVEVIGSSLKSDQMWARDQAWQSSDPGTPGLLPAAPLAPSRLSRQLRPQKPLVQYVVIRQSAWAWGLEEGIRLGSFGGNEGQGCRGRRTHTRTEGKWEWLHPQKAAALKGWEEDEEQHGARSSRRDKRRHQACCTGARTAPRGWQCWPSGNVWSVSWNCFSNQPASDSSTTVTSQVGLLAAHLVTLCAWWLISSKTEITTECTS